MPTCRDIITDAYRMAGVIGIGASPTAGEADFALIGLQGMFQAWVGSGLFGTMIDVFTSEDYTAAEGERVHVDACTVTIPMTVTNSDGTTRAPLLMSAVQIVTNAAVSTYIFDRNQWQNVETLTLSDECPAASFGRRGLAACLAIEIANVPAFAANVTPGLMEACRGFKTSLMRSRYAALDTREIEYF